MYTYDKEIQELKVLIAAADLALVITELSGSKELYNEALTERNKLGHSIGCFYYMRDCALANTTPNFAD